MTRRTYIERIRRFIYNGQPPADATITVGLVNSYLNDGIAVAAHKNYTDNFQLDGVKYTNSSFYTTYKNLAITKDEFALFKITLPHLPFGLGDIEGINTVILTDAVQNTYPVVLINQNQKSISRGMRTIPNKLIGYPESGYIYINSTVPLTLLTAKVTMVSGGSTDLGSTINVPDDYIPEISKYILSQLLVEHNQPLDVTPDGNDTIKTT